MTTAQIAIVCLTVLAVVLVVAAVTYRIGEQVVTERAAARDGEDPAVAAVAAVERRMAALVPPVITAVEKLALAARELHGASERSAPGPELVGRTLVIHTRKPDDQSVRGVVHAHHADRISLRDAVYLHATGEQAAGGLVTVPLEHVSTWQEIGPAT